MLIEDRAKQQQDQAAVMMAQRRAASLASYVYASLGWRIVSWSETRPLGDICRFSFLRICIMYYFYLNMGLFHSRKNAQKGEIFRDPEPIASFPFAHNNKGGCE